MKDMEKEVDEEVEIEEVEIEEVEKDTKFEEYKKLSEEDIEFIKEEDDNNKFYANIEEDKKYQKIDIEEKKSKVDVKKEILSWIKMIAAAVIIAFVINNFIIVNATVPTGSMENTIPTGSRMIGLRFSYLFNEPERGDIIIFKFQFDKDNPQNFVKRVIGLPGEKVKIEDATIEITKADGTIFTLDEPYLKEKWTFMTGPYIYTIPEDSYLVLGDNRNASSDTREWTVKYGYSDDLFIHSDQILGKAVFKYWPELGLLK